MNRQQQVYRVLVDRLFVEQHKRLYCRFDVLANMQMHHQLEYPMFSRFFVKLEHRKGEIR